MDTDTILHNRSKTHGAFTEHARITQNIKAAMRDSVNWDSLSAVHTEALEMIAHKIGRILAGDMNHIDHYADIQGYARLVENVIATNHATPVAKPAYVAPTRDPGAITRPFVADLNKLEQEITKELTR